MTIIQEFRAKLEQVVKGEDVDIYNGLSSKADLLLSNLLIPSLQYGAEGVFDMYPSFSNLQHWRIQKLTKAIRSCVVKGE
jgi:hypothetical protein